MTIRLTRCGTPSLAMNMAMVMQISLAIPRVVTVLITTRISLLCRARLAFQQDLQLELLSRQVGMTVGSTGITAGQSFTPKENGGQLIFLKQTSTQVYQRITSAIILQTALNSATDETSL